MHKRLRRSGSAGGLFAVLLLAALTIRLVVPAGYMPARAVDGIVIALCGGQGAVPLVIGMSRTGDVRITPANDSEGDRGPASGVTSCLFGAMGATLMLAAPIPLPAMALVAERIVPPPAFVRLAVAALVRPPARGPPSVA